MKTLRGQRGSSTATETSSGLLPRLAAKLIPIALRAEGGRCKGLLCVEFLAETSDIYNLSAGPAGRIRFGQGQGVAK